MRRPAGEGAPWRAWGFVAPALLWTAAFFLLPFAVMLAVSFMRREAGALIPAWSLDNYAKFFARGHFLEAMLNSLEVTVLVTVVSVVLAYPFAWIIAEKVPPRWQRLALVFAILPFWTSYVVRSYAWLLVLAKNGIVNSTLLGLGVIDEPLELANTRFATVLGFVHIVLPLTLPGIMVGAFLTFVLCIGDYITPQILGGNRELLMPQVIMLQIGRQADFPTASALSILLMVVVSLTYLAAARWLKLERA